MSGSLGPVRDEERVKERRGPAHNDGARLVGRLPRSPLLLQQPCDVGTSGGGPRCGGRPRDELRPGGAAGAQQLQEHGREADAEVHGHAEERAVELQLRGRILAERHGGVAPRCPPCRFGEEGAGVRAAQPRIDSRVREGRDHRVDGGRERRRPYQRLGRGAVQHEEEADGADDGRRRVHVPPEVVDRER